MTDNIFDSDEMKSVAPDEGAFSRVPAQDNLFEETVGEAPAHPGANETIVPKTTPGRSWQDDLVDGVSVINARDSAKMLTQAQKANPRLETQPEASFWGALEHGAGIQNLEAYADSFDHLADKTGDQFWARKAQSLRDSIKDGSGYKPIYESYKQIGGFKDFWGYAKEKVGEQIGVMAPSILGATALGAIGASQGELVGGKFGAKVGGIAGGIAGAAMGNMHHQTSEMRQALKREGMQGEDLVNYTEMGAAVLIGLDSLFPSFAAMKLGGFARKAMAGKVAEKLIENLRQGGKMRTAAEFIKIYGKELAKDAALETVTELAQQGVTDLGAKTMAGKKITAGDVEKFATETAPEVAIATIVGTIGMGLPGSGAKAYRDVRDAKRDAVVPGAKADAAAPEEGAPLPQMADGKPATAQDPARTPPVEDPSRDETPPVAEVKTGEGVLDFIRSQGGMLPANELESVDADRVPGLINPNGKSVNEIRMALVERGYLEESGPDQPDITSPDDVYDLIHRAMAGERVVPADEAQDDEASIAALHSDNPQKYLEWAEDTVVLPAIERYEDESGDPTLGQVYKKLQPEERIEAIERAREGEDILNVVQEIVTRNIDVEAVQAMVAAYGPNPELIDRIRTMLATQEPGLLTAFEDLVAQFPTRRPKVAREPVRKAGEPASELVRGLGNRLREAAGDAQAFNLLIGEIETDRKILKDDAFLIASDFLGRAPKKGTKASYFQAIRAAQAAPTRALNTKSMGAKRQPDQQILLRKAGGEGAMRQLEAALEAHVTTRKKLAGNEVGLAALDKAATATQEAIQRISEGAPEMYGAIQAAGVAAEALDKAAPGAATNLTTQHIRAAVKAMKPAQANATLEGGEGRDRLLPDKPAVPPKSSVRPGYIVSLIDGSKHTDLRPHLKKLGVEPEEYARNFRLADDYPLVAPNKTVEKHNATRQTETYDDFAKRFTIGGVKAAKAEALTAAQPEGAAPQAAPEPAAPPRDVMSELIGLANSKTPRDQWSAILGLSAHEMHKAEVAAVQAGILAYDKRGVARRAPQNTKLSAEGVAAEYRALLDERMPTEKNDVGAEVPVRAAVENWLTRGQALLARAKAAPLAELQKIAPKLLGRKMLKSELVSRPKIAAALESDLKNLASMRLGAIAQGGRSAALIAPGRVANEDVMLTPEAASKAEALQDAIDQALIDVLPAHMRVDVKANIEIARLAREDELLSLRSQLPAILEQDSEEVSDELSPDSASAGAARGTTDQGRGPAATAGDRARGDASGAPGADRRILRQESATLRADGSIIAGRPSREAGSAARGKRNAAALQPIGTTEWFEAPGYAGFVTAADVVDHAVLDARRAPKSEYRLATLTYRLYPENTTLPDAKRDVKTQLGAPLIWARVSQHTDGTWEVSMVQRSASAAKGKGLSQVLYAAIEKDLGIRMSPSGLLSEEGLRMWQKRSPESVKWHQWSQFEYHFMSPRRIKDRLDGIGAELQAIARRPDSDPDKAFDLAGARRERGELIKLWSKLPVEARAETPNMFSLRAFHGGPYDFDRFSLDYLGTGEGAQAFGHGLYFAENQAVGEYYRDALSRLNIDVDGKPLLADGRLVGTTGNKLVDDALVMSDGNVGAAMLNAARLASSLETVNPEAAAKQKEIIDALREFKGEVQTSRAGNLYEVEIDVKPEQLLDRDAKMLDQPEVMAKIIPLLEKVGSDVTPENLRVQFGSWVYTELEVYLGSPDAASRALKDAGIPGMRFFDQGSRGGAGEGSRNIVVFDDKLVKITQKNGKPVSKIEREAVANRLFSLGATQTPEFQRWFGDSKVIDAQGRPQVVYHGTARAGFEQFDTYGGNYGLMGQGGYFTEDPAVGSEYIEKGAAKMRRGGREPSQAVYPVYLSIKNPIDMDAKADIRPWIKNFSDYIDEIDLTDRLGETPTNEQIYRYVEDFLVDEQIPAAEGAEIMQDGLRAMGFDGITHIGGGRVNKDSAKHRVWIAFDPEQIKSVFNRGTFDPSDPRLSYSLDDRGRVLGQTDPYAESLSIGVQAIEAEARKSGRSMIEVAITAARHEALEFFNAIGLITAPEWAELQRTAIAEDWVAKTGVRAAYTRQFGKTMGPNQLEDLIVKEAIMEMYGRYRAGQYKPTGLIEKVMKRIGDVIDSLMRAVKGQGFTKWEQIFQKYDQGELKRRYEEIYGRGEVNTQAMIRAGVIPDARGIAQAPGAQQPARPASALQRLNVLPRDRPLKSLGELMDDFRRAAGLSARTGRINPALNAQARAAGGQHALGQYNGVARTRVQRDFDIFAHEAGHHLERTLGGNLRMLMTAHQAELLPLAGPVAGAGNTSLSEGYAEFFRRYLTNETAARAQAPNFYRAFENLVEAEDPRLFFTMQDVQSEYDRFLLGDPAERGAAQQTIVTRSPSALNRFLSDAERDGYVSTMGERLYDMWRGFQQNVFDKRHGWYLATRTLLEEISAQTGTRQTLRVVDNPNKLLRMASHTQAWALEDLKEGIALESRPNGGPGAVSMHQVLATAFGGTRTGLFDPVRRLFDRPTINQWDEGRLRDFGDYLVARRAIGLYVRFNPAFRNTIIQFTNANPQLRWLLLRLPQNIASEIPRPPTAEPLYEHLNRILTHEQRNPQFRAAAELYYQFNKDMIQLLFEKGLITREEMREYQQDRDYAPFQRNMADLETADGSDRASRRPGRARDTINKHDVYRRLEGSMRDIINPIQSTVQTMFEIRLRAAINDTLAALDRLARQAGQAGNEIFERLPPTEARAVEVNIREQLRQAARRAGMSSTDTALMLANVESQIGQNAVTQMFTQTQANERGEKIVWFFENGRPIPAQLPDGTLGRMMFEGLTAVGQRNMGAVMNALAGVSLGIRTGVTLALGFAIRNIIVDSMVAPINSRFASAIPGKTMLRGLREVLVSGEHQHLYNRYAGMLGGAQYASISDQSTERDIQLLQRRGFKVRRPRSIRDFFKMVFQVGEFTETGGRVGIFRNAMRSAIADGMSPFDAAVEAGHYAHDVMDFSQHGSKTEALRRVTPFFNASLQGMHRYVRSLSAHNDYGTLVTIWARHIRGLPLSTGEQRALGQAAKAWAISIGVFGSMSLIFAMLGADDEDMKEVPDSIRATHWRISINGVMYLLSKDPRVFMADEDEHTDWMLRLPKGFETAWFANGVERAWDYFVENDPEAAQGFVKDFFATTVPPHSIPGADVLYGFIMGRDMYSGNDIVPTYEKGPNELERKEQYGPYTSWLGKQLGETLNISPYYADFLIRNLGASLASDVAAGIDAGIGQGPKPSIAEYPVARRFTYNAGKTSESLGKFYNMMTNGEGLNQWFWDTLSEDARSFHSAANTYDKLVSAGGENSIAASEYLSRINPDQRAYAILATDFKGDVKSKYRNLHPMFNAGEGVRVTNAIMKEVAYGTLVANKDKRSEERKALDREQMRFARNELGHIRKGMAQNALFVLGIDGWRDQKLMDVDKRLDVLKAGAPDVYNELMRRLKKEKFQDAKHLVRVWPEVKKRLEASRRDAALGDLYGPVVER